MNIHEYQAKELLEKYGVAVPKGIPAMSVEEAVKAAESMETDLYVVKAQIHAGGRGAGHFTDNPEGKGGVRLCKTVADVKEAAEAMKITAKDLMKLKGVDTIVKEPIGGAHRNPQKAIASAGKAIDKALQELSALTPHELKLQRRERFYAIGREGLN